MQAANFSLGVNVLFKLAEDVARQIGASFDMEVVEMHHNQKIDAPSGTAMRIAEGLARGVNRSLEDVAVYGRHGQQVGKRTAEEIGIVALRGGDVVGEHTVIFAGPVVILSRFVTRKMCRWILVMSLIFLQIYWM